MKKPNARDAFLHLVYCEYLQNGYRTDKVKECWQNNRVAEEHLKTAEWRARKVRDELYDKHISAAEERKEKAREAIRSLMACGDYLSGNKATEAINEYNDAMRARKIAFINYESALVCEYRKANSHENSN